MIAAFKAPSFELLLDSIMEVSCSPASSESRSNMQHFAEMKDCTLVWSPAPEVGSKGRAVAQVTWVVPYRYINRWSI